MEGSQPDVALKFDRVTVSFDGEKPALDNISFEVPAGQTRVLFGAAGAGKTLVLKTVLGLQPADSGHIFVFGQEITRMAEHELFAVRSKIGMLFQESALFDSMTIEDNVGYPLMNQPTIQCPPQEVEKRVKDALHFVELDGTEDKFPSELSGGMRRRVGVARAMVTSPPLVLFDSPTAGLDPVTANTIMSLIVKQRDVNRTTTLLVTHRYKNGDLLVNYHYEPETAALEPNRNGHRPPGETRFLGFMDGKLIFEGSQAEMESSKDSYVSKFVNHNG
jgi:phospholipid/cholesterol/gamma-HCH transport system ATP-binding protein